MITNESYSENNIKDELFSPKLDETLEILDSLSISKIEPEEILWLKNQTQKEIEDLLDFKTIQKYNIIPETISYKIASDFLKKQKDIDIDDIYEEIFKENSPFKNMLNYLNNKNELSIYFKNETIKEIKELL